MLQMSMRATSGIFLPALRIRCRGSALTAVNSSFASTTATPTNSTHYWYRIGLLIHHPKYWPRISAFRQRHSRKFHCRISGFSRPTKENSGGTIRVADSSNFNVATTVAAALITVRPGGVREMHWHPNADEWQYYIKGKGRMTVFNTGPNALTMDFNAGDIGYVKKNLGHYIENVGDTDLQFIGVFRAPRYQEISLSNWLTHTPPALVAQHLNIDEATIAKWPDNAPGVMPKS
jgi:oxalate decarboxylase family bicupin protein